MKASLSLLGVLLVVFISDQRVSGACHSLIANTDWATCLPGNKCPGDLLELDDDEECGNGYKCCLMRPTFNLNVIDAPCIIGGVDEAKPADKYIDKDHHTKHKHSHH